MTRRIPELVARLQKFRNYECSEFYVDDEKVGGSLEFSERDLESSLKRNYVSSFSFSFASQKVYLSTPIPRDSNLVFQKTENGVGCRFLKNESDFTIEIWSQLDLLKRVKVTKESEASFSDLYLSPVFGKPNFCSSKKLCFVGEKTEAKLKSYWESEEGSKKFKEKLNFGETLEKYSNPRVYVLDEKLVEVNETDCVGHPIITSSGSLIYCVYEEATGLSYCQNRKTSLYFKKHYSDEDRILITENYLSTGPKLSKDEKHLIFLGSKEKFSSHLKGLDLTICNYDDEKKEFSTFRVLKQDLHGYYPRYDFFDEFVIFEFWLKGRRELSKVNVKTGIEKPVIKNFRLLAVSGRFALCESSRLLEIPKLLVLDLITRAELIIYFPEDEKVSEIFSKTSLEILEIEGGGEGFFLKPENSDTLVCRIHGGPHSVSLDTYSLETTLYLFLGHSVLLPNYRGSLSYPNIESLLGSAGVKDLHDCFELIEKTKIQKVALYGGSHGGYLVARMIAERKFAAAALWNPVTNLIASFASSDIPEWTLAEFSENHELRILTKEDLVKLYEVSPISKVSEIDSPCLLVLGEKDLRVPANCNGIEFARGLKKFSKSPDLRVYTYEGEGHALDKEAFPHAVTTIAEFLDDYL